MVDCATRRGETSHEAKAAKEKEERTDMYICHLDESEMCKTDDESTGHNELDWMTLAPEYCTERSKERSCTCDGCQVAVFFWSPMKHLLCDNREDDVIRVAKDGDDNR